MTLDALNRLPEEAAIAELRRCCGSLHWAREMAAARPFADAEEMRAKADRTWAGLEISDWLEAFRAHSKIGALDRSWMSGEPGESGRSATSGWSAEEQAGVATATDAARERLADLNHQYQTRFGFIFIVCATGKSASEMLALLEQRLANSRDEELRIAAEEQCKITHLRLAKLLQA